MRSSLTPFLLLPVAISALTFDCEQIRDDGQSFNLKSLGGPKTVHDQEWLPSPPTIKNTTFTIDICKPLKDDAKKGERCPSGTRVCAKKWNYRGSDTPYLDTVVPIAGEYTTSHGANRGLDPKFTRLKGSAGNSDEREGILVELHGGKYPDDSSGVTQKAIIEFLCDKDVTGNEGFEDEKSIVDATQYQSMQKRADDDEGKPELPDLDKGKSLEFRSYKLEDETQVLRLRWKSKYACEGMADSGGGSSDKTKGWGFFTWFIIIVFLLAAAYIIFGSWLNYNRYGARGWDLIPHGDTIRDIPYIVKDWTTGIADKLKGQNSRGGYSAV